MSRASSELRDRMRHKCGVSGQTDTSAHAKIMRRVEMVAVPLQFRDSVTVMPFDRECLRVVGKLAQATVAALVATLGIVVGLIGAIAYVELLTSP